MNNGSTSSILTVDMFAILTYKVNKRSKEGDIYALQGKFKHEIQHNASRVFFNSALNDLEDRIKLYKDDL